MIGVRTFGQKIAAGFLVVVLLTLVVGVIAVESLRTVVAGKDHIIGVDNGLLVTVEALHVTSERRARWVREYLVTADEPTAAELARTRQDFDQGLQRLRQLVTTASQRERLDQIEQAARDVELASERVIAVRKGGGSTGQVGDAFESDIAPVQATLDARISEFGDTQRRSVAIATRASSRAATTAIWLLLGLICTLALVATAVAVVLVRWLNRQITASVGQVQGSMAKLRAAATQQATGLSQQATATTEISTTVIELLATTRQIAESAQHVAQIAERAAESARTGDVTVARAHDSIGGVRTQVDLIVGHMLDVGEKSQQVGGVLEIVSELAEQTNILAINASIEAAGAGEAGTRFAVVADEIRKLADRVGASTKEIRSMIDEVRGAVNTTVMATETGSKSVDAGARQFAEVSTAFRQIAELVQTTTQAAREIELSTKQQMGGVEQVKIATASVAQAAREAETGASETAKTASQLVTVSHDLMRLVHANGPG